MVRKAIIAFVVFCLPVLVFPRDAARDLKKLVGYTIVLAGEVSETVENSDGDKIIKMISGERLKVSFLLLDPLYLTDVVVFAKPLSKELVKKYGKTLPERYLYSYKILIENEIFDAALP